MFEQTAHRPWQLPKSPWVMTQTWKKLLFAHWPIEPNLLRAKIPAPLELDTFDETAWITIVPFQMGKIRFRLIPPIPGTYPFPELNVRTYVTYQGKGGVYFFNIEADHHLAVWAAKRFAYLPYTYTNITWQERSEQIHFTCYRKQKPLFEISYQPTSSANPTKMGSLDHWLMERYCLYTTYHHNLYRGEIHHRPWLVQQAKVQIIHNAVFDDYQLHVKNTDPLFHYADQLQIWAWPMTKCRD